ncbi:MAG: LamG-like jellyroll fold domain-containing protein [Planctomycetota bacterium]
MSVGNRWDELESLVFDWQDGCLDIQGIERLRSILRADVEAQRHFIQITTLESAIRNQPEMIPQISGDKLSEKAVQQKSAKSRSFLTHQSITAMASLAAAACLLIGLFGLPNWSRPKLEMVTTETKPDRKNLLENTATGVAFMTRVNPKTESNDRSTNDVSVSPGVVEVQEGFMQLEFFCGATLVLEGPAALDIHSSSVATVKYGKVRAEVPPAARGFTLRTPDFEVIDLGTEFGLEVSKEGSEVQVFDGEVEIHSHSGFDDSIKKVFGGEAVKGQRGSELTSAKLTPEAFTSIETLELELLSQQTQRFQRWKKFSDQLRKDSRLVSYYAFESEEMNQRILKSSIDPNDKELNGAIVGADLVAGRWMQKGALEFKHPGDRIRIHVDGQFDNLTFFAWVRIDSLDRWYNSLFLTDGYDQFEPHWQIMDSGSLFFSNRVYLKAELAKGQMPHQTVLSDPFWDPSQSGRWFHLVAVFDNQAKTISHYVNGSLQKMAKIPEEFQVDYLKIGNGCIGNWDDPIKPDEEFVVRNLNGRVDEFGIFNAALSAAEIQEMYQQGSQ